MKAEVGPRLTRQLLDLKTPYGSVGENVAHFTELFRVMRRLFILAGSDSVLLVLSVVVGFFKVPIALTIGQMWPWMAMVMDQGLDFGGTLLTMVFFTNVMSLMGFIQNRLKDSFFPRYLERIQLAGVRACLEKDVGFWDSGDPAQQVMWMFQQAELVKDLLSHVETTITCLFTLGGAVVHVYSTSVKFTMVAVLSGLATGAYMMWLNALLATVTGAMDHTLSDLKAGCIESLTNIRTVQAFACEMLESTRFLSRKGHWWNCKKQFRLVEGVRRGSELLIQHARALGINYGGFLLVCSGKMQVGDVLIIQALLAEMLVSSFDSLVAMLRVISIDLVFTQLYFGILDAPVAIRRKVGADPRRAARGALSLQDVRFSYPSRPDDLVLRGVSLEVPAGSFTALVGSSGSGKTTIGRLLERFYDVRSGCIFLDGVDLRDLRPMWVRRQVGYVEQEPKLFRGTVRENIMYGNPSAGQEEVEKAAVSAHVMEFASHLPQGLDTNVASGGYSLSGGQKQRVAIARAMIRSPAMIIMDEATSALDTETERSVQEAIERLLSGRTTLVVAHRLTTVLRADQIAVMGAGRILEVGTHAELSARPGGVYAGLMQHQQLQPEKAAPSAAPGVDAPRADASGAGVLDAGDAAMAAAARMACAGGVDATDAGVAGVGAAGAGAADTADACAVAGASPADAGAVGAGTAGGSGALGDESPGAEAAAHRRQRGQLPVEQPEPAPAVVEPERQFMQTAAAMKRSADGQILSAPTSNGFFPQLLWMYRLMGRRKWLLLLCLLLSIAEARFRLQIGPAFSKASSFLDSPADYAPAFQEYLTIMIWSFLLQFLKERIKDFFEPHLAEQLQWKVYYKLLHQDVDYFEMNDPANLVPRLFDQADFSALCTTMATENFIHGVSALLFNVYQMYVLSPPVLAWTLAMSLPTLLIYWGLSMAQAGPAMEAGKAASEIAAVAVESLSNVRTMKAFGGEDLELAKLVRARQIWWRAEMRRRPLAIASDVWSTFLGTNMVFVVMVVIMKYKSGRFSSTLAALLFMVKVFWDDCGALMITVGLLGNAKTAFNTIVESLREPTAIEADVGDIPAARAAGRVDLRSVCFTYRSRPDKEVLRGVSLSIPAGSFTAVVGHSGSGKTTLGRLLMRFHDVGGGQILLDGHPYPSLQPQWLRKQVGYVEQEPMLFNETLWNNVRYGRLDASNEEILGAAIAANVHSFATALPGAFETNVGRLGQNLSGGQKQRVAIARALLVNPVLLLLDEATSALDSQTEHEVQEAVDRLMAGRTSVVIAHRLSTVAKASQVVVLDAGRVVQVGTHRELAERGGLYARLLAALASDGAAAANGGAPAGEATADGEAGAAEGVGGAEEGGLRRRR